MNKVVTEFVWDQQSAEALRLLVDGYLTDEQIAKRCDVSRTTLAKWKRHPTFRKEREKWIQTLERGILRRGVGNLNRRIARADRRWQAIEQFIQARGESAEMENVPGGKTGLLRKTVKRLSNGAVIEEYRFDAAILRTERKLQEHVAKELGQ